MTSNVVPVEALARPAAGDNSESIYRSANSGELVIAVVGHVGSGTSTVATKLRETLQDPNLSGGPYETVILKARKEIEMWAEKTENPLPDAERNDLDFASCMQDLGDQMRNKLDDHASVARALVARIRLTRAEKQGCTVEEGKPVAPDGKRKAYILDALRHPAELALLRHLYQPAFALLGVVCDTGVRRERVGEKFKNAGRDDAEAFMNRDEDSGLKHGQRVGDTFHKADYFINNTERRLQTDEITTNPEWDVVDQLSRFIKILTKSEIVRPTRAETAMHAAFGAKVRSACLSRQVGACLVDATGTIVSTGTNEAPRAGGGVYPGETGDLHDHRCAYRDQAFCSNTKQQQQQIIDQLLDSLELPDNRRESARRIIRSGPVGRLLEFSRAVHAEMEALLTASRLGRSTQGTKLFVTTFPCHYCARHLVSAGVDEVQYIEPYSKSKAIEPHGDAITTSATNWKPPSSGGKEVLFKPFAGVAPRLYERAFSKDRQLKDKLTGELQLGHAEWGGSWVRERVSYPELEAKLAGRAEGDG